MTFRRRGFVHRLTAMVLAFAMPLCCCVVNGLTGSNCCSGKVVEAAVPSCCAPSTCCQTQQASQAAPSDASERGETSGSCACCIKVPGPIYDWTVPVDSIGTLIVDLSTTIDASAMDATALLPSTYGLDASSPTWQRIAAGCGHTILHC